MSQPQSQSGPLASGPSSRSTSTGSWQPLPYIHSGFVVYPFHPETSPPPTPTTLGDNSKPSSLPLIPPEKYLGSIGWNAERHVVQEQEEEEDDSRAVKRNPYEIPLDVGDEFYAFEQYQCTVGEDGRGDLWYRGFVVQAVAITSLAPPPSSSISSTHPAPFPRPEPSVLTGIFPAGVCHIRPGAPNDDGQLRAAYEKAVKSAEERHRLANGGGSGIGIGLGPIGTSGWAGEMEKMDTVKEEDEAELDRISEMSHAQSPIRGVVDVGPQEGKAADGLVRRRSVGGGISRASRPMSLALENMQEGNEEAKEQPPLPKLTAGDSTIAGQQWPLVDEIACAIREWYGRLPTYLANREYRLFSTVMQHIDALFLGRRQLLSQMLSGDELVRVRRECVSRLVKCNVAQGLDIIVRSLEDGSVMVVDRERAYSGTSWVGGITCYVYQVRLAYIDLIPLDTVFGKPFGFPEPRGTIPTSRPFVLPSSKSNPSLDQQSGSYYHLLLDVRAFIANPCAPGETAELFFSLYNKAERRFITEEFCLVLNHYGSPARDSEQRLGRLRTLYTDLKPEDLGLDIYLVCRIVRNGALKMRLEGGTGTGTWPGASAGRRSSLYGIAEATGTMRSHGQAPSSANLTDDSFSVTSGYGPEIHRPPTVESSAAGAQGSVVEGRPSFRRPLGCAVMSLPQLATMLGDGVSKAGEGVEKVVRIYLPKDEATFATLHEDIIHNRVKEFGTSSRAEGIAISLKAFQGATSQLTREHPSLLLDIPTTARLGFPDVVYPGSVRNDLYVTLCSASFSPAPSSSGGSIRVRKSVTPAYHGDVQVTVEVRKMDGTVVQEGLTAGGSGEPPMAQYQSMVFSHNDRPAFGELVKISLPTTPVDYHLFLTFRSRGKDKNFALDPLELEKPFAFAYLPLSEASASIKDGDHQLVLYKMEKGIQLAPNIYYELPSVAVAGEAESSHTPPVARSLTPLRDRMLLRTHLCSSIQTQDDTLRALFAWQTTVGDLDGLCETLQLFGFVPEEEISKFVPRVFDALFGMLVANLEERQDQVNDLAFKSLIKVLAMTSDRRFPNFCNVLDAYVDKSFNYPASSFHLLRSMKVVMSTPDTKEYRAFLKVWHLFFRFIIRSREQDRSRDIGLDATSAHIEADFQRQTKSILGEINNLMFSTDKTLIGTQTLAVQHYSDILPDLGQVFQPIEIAEMVITFADSLTYSRGSIAVYKLLLLLQVVRYVFETQESRSLLVPAIVRWIKPHLGRYDEYGEGREGDEAARDAKRVKWLECNRLATTVLAWTINKLQEWHVSPVIQEDHNLRTQEEDNIEYCLTLLPALIVSYTEQASAKTLDTLKRHRSSTTSTIWKPTPDIFPTSHPFPLISQLPPPSLLERHQHAEDDGLPHSELFNCGLAESAVVIITLVLASPRQNILRWLAEVLEIEGVDACGELLLQCFDFAKSVIRFEAFPSQWLTLRLMCFSGILKLLDCIAQIMEKDVFVPPPPTSAWAGQGGEAPEFNVVLWRTCFELLCDFCGSDELALEERTQQSRRAEWIVAGDLRDEGAGLLMRLWNAIGWPLDVPGGDGLRYGGHQTRFTNLADRILGLCLSSHDAMCETAVEILFSMIYAEYLLDGSLDAIETDVFATLDKLFTSNTAPSTADPTMRAYFVAQLRAVFEASPEIDSSFSTKVSTFLSQVEHFIDLLLALREIPNNTLWKDERASAIYRIMSFVSRIGRKDLYVRYVHELVGINKGVKDWLGAGMALKLHADVYEWRIGGDAWVDAGQWGELKLPAQSEFARKQAIYYHVLEYFAEAEAYESSLELCQELTAQHQKTTYDVGKLSELLAHQAKLWEKVGQTFRPKQEYFRVMYYGEVAGLDRSRHFVHRASDGQRYNDFCETIQLKYPHTSIHRSKIPPPDTIKNGTDPVIWITPVTPEPDLTRAVFGDEVSDNAQSYWRWNGVKRFSSVRPYLKDPTEREAVLTWTEKTVLITKEDLPGVLSRSEVLSVRYEHIAPVAMAIMEVGRATNNLKRSNRGKSGQLPEQKALGAAISSAVDSPISEGVKTYRRIFLEGSYLDKHPADTAQVEQLREAIMDYVRAIQDNLGVHEQVCRDIAFHEALKTQFYKSFPEEVRLLPRISISSADSTPDLGFSGSVDNHGSIRFSSPTKSHPPVSFSSPSKRFSTSTYSPSESKPSNQSFSSPSPVSHVDSGTYHLPALRLGRSPTPNSQSQSLLSGASPHTPRESTSTTRHTSSSATPNLPGRSPTPQSSPRRAPSKSGSLRVKKAEHRNSLTSPLGDNEERNMSTVSFSQRALSMVGMAGGGGEGTAHDGVAGDVSRSGSGVRKEKGLKRLGSLIRRN
ncbi:hypothetical protein IAT38_006454 [Cryptococcus sp. DSM 104549]